MFNHRPLKHSYYTENSTNFTVLSGDVTILINMFGKKLLVADDSLTIQKVIRLALSNEGYVIQTVSDGHDTIEQISIFRPDIILIDVSLPGKSAFEVKNEINLHSEFQNTRFILMSSAFEQVDETQAEATHFHGRLTKPFDPAHLRKVLTDALGEGSEPIQSSIQSNSPSHDSYPPLQMQPPPAASLEQFSSPEASNTLWEPGQDITESKAEGSFDNSNDIKHLLDSTLQMSNEEDFQWSVNEPSIKPFPDMLDQGGSTFELDPKATTETEAAFQENLSRFEPPLSGPPESIRLSLPEALPEIEEPLSQIAHPSEMTEMTEMETSNFKTSPLSQEQIETMVQKQIQITLERMAQKILPEVAERIIKQEIHRMLTE